MAHIVIADDTNAYHGRSGEVMPLGGTESSVIHLAEAFAARGHRVDVLTRTDTVTEHRGVTWAPLADAGRYARPDLYLPVQHPRLFGRVARPRRLAVWLIWPVNNLRHYKRIPAMWRYRPVPVVASRWQADTYSWVLPPPAPIVIPLAVEDGWRGMAPLSAAPPPRAVYASMPQRGLPWLLPVWQDLILPNVPRAELHVLGLKVFAAAYSDTAPSLPWVEAMTPEARATVKLYPGLPRERQREVMRASRVYLYHGHKSEAFCLAAAEAQALGVPAVVGPQTVLPERVREGQTGCVRDAREAFAAAAVDILTQDDLWRGMHEASLTDQQGPSWIDVAGQFEAALL